MSVSNFVYSEPKACPQCGKKKYFPKYKPTGKQMDIDHQVIDHWECSVCGWWENA